jgi:hypothetical protein
VNEGDAGPLVVDWDGDGAHDLIVGAGDGAVLFFKNESKSGLPKLAAGVELLPASAHAALRDRSKAPPKDAVGVRVKVHATDWNGDGLLDLLVGDFVSATGPEPKLTDEQKTERTRLEAEQEAIFEKMRPIYERAEKAAREALKLEEDEEIPEDRADAYFEAQDAALNADPAYGDLQKRQMEIYEKLRPLQASRTTHGHVHVLLRKAPKKA